MHQSGGSRCCGPLLSQTSLLEKFNALHPFSCFISGSCVAWHAGQQRDHSYLDVYRRVSGVFFQVVFHHRGCGSSYSTLAQLVVDSGPD